MIRHGTRHFIIYHLGEPVGAGLILSDELIIKQLDALNQSFKGGSVQFPGPDAKIQFKLVQQTPFSTPTSGIIWVEARSMPGYEKSGIQNFSASTISSLRNLVPLPSRIDVTDESHLRLSLCPSPTAYHLPGHPTLGSGEVEDYSVIVVDPSCPTQNAEFWNDPTIWSYGQVPDLLDVVHINHEVTVPEYYTAMAARLVYPQTISGICLSTGVSIKLTF